MAWRIVLCRPSAATTLVPAFAQQNADKGWASLEIGVLANTVMHASWACTGEAAYVAHFKSLQLMVNNSHSTRQTIAGITRCVWTNEHVIAQPQQSYH